MFFAADTVVPLSLATARAALNRALAEGGLIAESRRANDDGLAFLARVGPSGAPFPRKQVLLHVLPSRDVDGSTVVPLRWDATGATGQWFPSLDANLTLTEADAESTVVAVIGTYSPPLGSLGAAIDRAVLSTAATATARTLIREVAAQLGRMDATQNNVDRPPTVNRSHNLTKPTTSGA